MDIATSLLVKEDKPKDQEEPKASTAKQTIEEKPEECATIPDPAVEESEKKMSVESATETHEKDKPSAPKRRDEQLEKEDDNDKELQAALYASMQIPRSPQGDSGVAKTTKTWDDRASQHRHPNS